MPVNDGVLGIPTATSERESCQQFEANLPLIYLALPSFLFLAIFVKLIYAIPLLTLLMFAPFRIVRSARVESGSWIAAILGAVFVVIITGFSSLQFPSDWFKHWALLNELANNPWSLRTEVNGSPTYLRFYLAAYLVPALTHHVFPIFPLWLTTMAWFGFGIALILRAATVVARKPSHAYFAMLLILVLGGADFYAETFYRMLNQLPIYTMGIIHETWPSQYLFLPVQYNSFLTALVWSPHQSIATCLVASMLMAAIKKGLTPQTILAYGLFALWSPYGMIGLLPLIAVIAAQQKNKLINRDIIIALITGVGFAIIIAWYLSTDIQDIGIGFRWVPYRLLYLEQYAQFLAFALVPYILLLRKHLIDNLACRVSFITLLVIPFLHGSSQDFVMQASLGPLFILGLSSVDRILNHDVALRQRLVQIVALLLCVPTFMTGVVYLQQKGNPYLLIPKSDPIRRYNFHLFTNRTDYTVDEFFNIAGLNLKNQYFSSYRPAVIRE